jgi:hypothetical protein
MVRYGLKNLLFNHFRIILRKSLDQLIKKTRPDPLLWLVLAVSLPAQEVQQHGVVFEEWVREEFFGGYTPESYTQKWDIPAGANLRFGGYPVNPKATKYRSPVGLGDALRQYDIAEPFILLLGFWQQDDDVKRFVNITPVTIHPETWRMMWGPVTREDLERLNSLIKDRSIDYREVRNLAQEIEEAGAVQRLSDRA